MTLSTRIALFVAIALAPVLLDDLYDRIGGRDIISGTMSATALHLPAERQITNVRGG